MMKKSYKIMLSLLAFVLCLGMIGTPVSVHAQESSNQRYLIPKPLESYFTEGEFVLNQDTKLYVYAQDSDKQNEIYKNIGESLQKKIKTSTGYNLTLTKGKASESSNYIQMSLTNEESLGNEGYKIQVTNSKIELNAYQPEGLFNAYQTLRQLFPAEIEMKEVAGDVTWNVPNCEINDKPEYNYRGFMIDSVRHFFTVDQVKRQIDLASQYKINKLHLRLADDQGWRLEIKGELYGESLTKLLTIGASTSCTSNGERPGYYTQEEFKELVAYAQAHYVEIIPEFDMPGHTWAALVSLNFLNSASDGKPHSGSYDNTKPYQGWDVGFSSYECNNDKTYGFVEEVIKQVSAISPSQYLHIGGDEAHSTSSADYNKFFNIVTEMTQRYGKTPIGWQNYDTVTFTNNNVDTDNTVTQFWSKGNVKCKSGIKYVISAADHAYMDMKYDGNSEFGLTWATYNPVDDAYNWDPLNYGTKDQIVGIEAPLFSETLASDYALDYMIYPRLAGHAEIGWTPKEMRSWDEYKTRLIPQKDRWTYEGIQFYRDESLWPKPYIPVNAEFLFDENNGTTTVDTNAEFTGTINNKNDNTWTKGIHGSALNFDGSNFVDLDVRNVKGDWTIGMWLKNGNMPSTDAVLLGNQEGDIKLEQWKNTGKLGVSKYGVKDETFNYSAPEGEWVYLTFVGDSNGTDLYVNGEHKDHVNLTISAPVKRIGASAKSGLASTGNMIAKIDDLYINNEALTAEQVKALYTANLPTNKEALLNKINEAGQYSQASYTKGSFKNLSDALTKAQEIYNDDSVKQNEVDDAVEVLTKAIEGLVDLSKLQSKVQEANQLKEIDYTKATWKVFNDAFNKAKEVLDNENASQDDVDKACTDLTDAINQLATPANKTALQEAVEESKNLDESLYTPKTWKPLADALKAAQKVLDNENAVQDEADQALKTLNDAVAQILEKANKEALQKAVQELPDYNQSIYTKDSWNHFARTLENAKKVLADENAVQQDADDALKALNDGIAQLLEAANKEALQMAVEKAKTCKESAYTKDSWKQFKKALDAANKVLADDNAIQTDADEALKNLNLAISQLVKAQTAQKTTTDDNAEIEPLLIAMFASVSLLGGMVYRRKREQF